MKAFDEMVSFFHRLRDKVPASDMSLAEILDGIKTGRWDLRVKQLRAEQDPDIRKSYKNSLSLFTGSARVKTRSSDDVIEHSGYIILDLDKVEDMDNAWEKVTADPYTAFAFRSCSNQGIAVGVGIDPTKHTESYEGLSDHYAKQYDLEVDPSCKDVARARFVSFDPQTYLNAKAKKYVVPADPAPKEGHEPSAAPVAVSDYQEAGKWSDGKKYSWCKKIIDKDRSYRDGERHRYLFAFAGFCNKAGVSEAYTTSQMVSDFETSSKTASQIESIVAHCYKRSNEFGTFVIRAESQQVPKVGNDEALKGVYREVHKMNRDGKTWGEADVEFVSEKQRVGPDVVRNIFQFIYEQNKDEFNLSNKPEIKQVEITLLKNFDLRDNLVTGQREFKRKGDDSWEPLNVDTLNRFLQHRWIKFPLNQLKSLTESDFVKPYDEFKEFFKALPIWDYGTDHIDHLASHVQAEDQEFFRIQFKKTLVRCIACSVYGDVNRMIFVLVSPKQELGKSTFIRFLNPFPKGGYTETPLRDDKDSKIRTAENFIYNLEELSSLTAKNVNALKAVISMERTKERRPYAHFEEDRIRRCNFFGSTNQEEFLADTLNTRWLCFTINDIDWSYKQDVDISKVWAQAHQLYLDGFNYQLTKEEKAKREEINKKHELSSNESDLISKHLYVIKPDDKAATFVSVADIIAFLTTETNSRFSLNNYAVGRAMTSLGFVGHKKRINGNQVRGYWVGLVKDRPVPTPKAISPKGDLLSEFDI